MRSRTAVPSRSRRCRSGILVNGRTFVGLRPRKRGMTLAIELERRLDSPRVTRYASMGERGWSNGVPIVDPSEVDDEIRSWLVEAFDLAADARR